ncbi:MAG TPA: DbpA RNA binding domain-containing protein, partial [Bacteroidia bacterium]|nr:DbpA RNA binding domain-containing protein [Bacteroidia bacterium]
EACEKQLFSLVKKIHNVEVNETAIEAYMPKIYDELKELSKEDIIKRFVSTEFNRFLDYYKNAPDLNASSSGRERERSVPGITKLFINLGELDSLDRTSMKEYISEVSGVSTDSIVSVEVKSSFSFIEVKSEAAEIISGTFKNVRYNNRNVRIESRGSESSRGGGYEGKRSYNGGSYGNKGGFGSGRGSRNGGGFSKSYGNSDRSSYGERNKSYDRPERIAARGNSSDQGGDRKNNFTREKRPRKQF